MINPKRWRRIPPEPQTLGGPSPSLSLEARKQWEEVRSNEKSLRRYTRAWATAEHENAVFAEATRALHSKLKSGPVDGSVLAYMKTICKRKAGAHRKKIANDQERLHPVGDDIWLLEADGPSTAEESAVMKEIRESLEEKLPILKTILTDQQYKIFLLAEAEEMNCYQISEALNNRVSPGAVRQSLKAARDKLKNPRSRARLGVSPLTE